MPFCTGSHCIWIDLNKPRSENVYIMRLAIRHDAWTHQLLANTADPFVWIAEAESAEANSASQSITHKNIEKLMDEDVALERHLVPLSLSVCFHVDVVYYEFDCWVYAVVGKRRSQKVTASYRNNCGTRPSGGVTSDVSKRQKDFWSMCSPFFKIFFSPYKQT